MNGKDYNKALIEGVEKHWCRDTITLEQEGQGSRKA